MDTLLSSDFRLVLPKTIPTHVHKISWNCEGVKASYGVIQWEVINEISKARVNNNPCKQTKSCIWQQSIDTQQKQCGTPWNTVTAQRWHSHPTLKDLTEAHHAHQQSNDVNS